ncbi:MAG: hypothetical protein JWM27_2456 [Gemmatimonadetes bacterium]|nr:hypothetical protein [Gemmatimonadota bacterium]
MPHPPPLRVRARRRSRDAGYTFMEMITVLVLLGILATLALPRLDVTGYRSDAALHSVGTLLLSAQRAAVMKQHAVVVAFDVTGRRIRVHDDLNDNGAIDAGEGIRWEPLDDGMVFGQGSAPAAAVGAGPVTFTKRQTSWPAVTFLRNGSAGEEGGVYLTSRRAVTAGGRPRDARLVTVARATGRPSWLSYASGSWKTEF